MLYLLGFYVALTTGQPCTCSNFQQGAKQWDEMCQYGENCSKAKYNFLGDIACGSGKPCILDASCPCGEGSYQSTAVDGDLMCAFGSNCASMKLGETKCSGNGRKCFLTLEPEDEEIELEDPFLGCYDPCTEVNMESCDCVASMVQWFNRQEKIALDDKESIKRELSDYPKAIAGLLAATKVFVTKDWPWSNYDEFFGGNAYFNGNKNWKFTKKMASDFQSSLEYASVHRSVIAEGEGHGMLVAMAGFALVGLTAGVVLHLYAGKRTAVEIV